jgi:hypothetical protein
MRADGGCRAALPQGKNGQAERYGTHTYGQAGPHKPDDLRRHSRDSNSLLPVFSMIEPGCNKLMTAILLRHYGNP